MMTEELKVPFFKPAIGDEEKQAVLKVMDSGWLTTGQVTHDFEQAFAEYTGAEFALAVNSNTNGMIIAMEACGVKPGKAVITTPYTFVSTAATAVHLGADVYFADIEENSYSIDPEKIREILKNDKEHKVCAIVPVHIAGNLCNMKEIKKIAEEFSTPQNKIYVIEDAAHSFPSKTKNGFAGTFGDAGIFSFYVTKTITTGEGGMITTNSPELAKRMTQMRLHGMNRDAWDRYTSPKASWEYDIIAPGFKANLPDILSAIGIEQLKKAENFRIDRTSIVKKYNEAFAEYPYFILPPDGEGNAWHLYLLQIDETQLDCDRNTFARELQENGLGISMHFIALFNFTYWKEKYPDFTKDNFPNAQKHYQRTITLPLWPGMTEKMIDKVINVVIKTGKKHYVCKN